VDTSLGYILVYKEEGVCMFSDSGSSNELCVAGDTLGKYEIARCYMIVV
jgi:hypothetical protein